MSTLTQPTFFIPHGAGPCFFMDWTLGPADTWDRMEVWLRRLLDVVPERPQAVVLVSAHWEAPVFSVQTNPSPELLFDYYNFPPHTYELKYPAEGAPALAKDIVSRIKAAGIEVTESEDQPYDHGVFVPMLLIDPDASIPVVQVSLRSDLDPAAHIALGGALAPLREQGVLMIGSGMSYHNLGGFRQGRGTGDSVEFDDWLQAVCAAEPENCRAALLDWTSAPKAREVHPREEHLLPLMVVAGAAHEDKGCTAFTDSIMGFSISGFRFG